VVGGAVGGGVVCAITARFVKNKKPTDKANNIADEKNEILIF
jgi:hypothetical protein